MQKNKKLITKQDIIILVITLIITGLIITFSIKSIISLVYSINNPPVPEECNGFECFGAGGFIEPIFITLIIIFLLLPAFIPFVTSLSVLIKYIINYMDDKQKKK